jgi:hypothetical protein
VLRAVHGPRGDPRAASVRLRLAKRDGAAGFGLEELEVIRLKAGLSVARFRAPAGIAESRPAARRMEETTLTETRR